MNNATGGRNDTGSYRIPIAVQFLYSLILFFGMLILPETPRFLIKKDRHEDAARALSKIRRLTPDHPAIQAEISEVKVSYA